MQSYGDATVIYSVNPLALCDAPCRDWAALNGLTLLPGNVALNPYKQAIFHTSVMIKNLVVQYGIGVM